MALLSVEPSTVDEALSSQEGQKWRLAMREELESHSKNNTWTLVDVPTGKNVIKGKWVFKLKTNDAGEVARYKARYVAKGFSQKYGIDYAETFSPVIRHNSIRYLIALSLRNGMHINQMDVETAETSTKKFSCSNPRALRTVPIKYAS